MTDQTRSMRPWANWNRSIPPRSNSPVPLERDGSVHVFQRSMLNAIIGFTWTW